MPSFTGPTDVAVIRWLVDTAERAAPPENARLIAMATALAVTGDRVREVIGFSLQMVVTRESPSALAAG